MLRITKSGLKVLILGEQNNSKIFVRESPKVD